MDTLGQLLATPADEDDRAKVGELVEAMREATGESVEVAFVNHEGLRSFITCDRATRDAAEHGIQGSETARNYERLPEMFKGLYLLAFSILLLTRFVTLMAEHT